MKDITITITCDEYTLSEVYQALANHFGEANYLMDLDAHWNNPKIILAELKEEKEHVRV